MKFEYTAEQLKAQDYLILLILNENGFNTKRVNIEKVTPKKVYVDEYIPHKGYLKNIYHHDVGGDIEGDTKGLKMFGTLTKVTLSYSILLLESDVETAQEQITNIAIKQIENRIALLQRQRELIEGQ